MRAAGPPPAPAGPPQGRGPIVAGSRPPPGEAARSDARGEHTSEFSVRLVDWASDSASLKSVRHEVFVVEQRVPENLEWDEIDPRCVHALAEDGDGGAIGCGRLLPDGHIGRVAVRATWRGNGVGATLLECLIEAARARGDRKLRLNAQTHAMPFYARFGFAPAGEPFEEAGIAHQAMERSLDPTA